jgi:hypothetical protein
MKRGLLFSAVLLIALTVTLPPQASAQGVFLGAGLTLPTGDYGEYADAGWIFEGGVSFPIVQNRVFLFADGLFGSNSHGDVEGDKTNLLGGLGGVELSFADEDGRGFFVFGELGFLRHDYKSDEYPQFEGADTGLAFGAGGGYGIPLGGRLMGWVLGRYLQAQFDEDDGNTSFLGVMAGVSIPIGG